MILRGGRAGLEEAVLGRIVYQESIAVYLVTVVPIQFAERPPNARVDFARALIFGQFEQQLGQASVVRECRRVP